MRRILFVPYLVWMGIFVIIPIGLLVGYSFFDIEGELTFQNYQDFFSWTYLQMSISSFWYAFLITFFALVICYPLALVIRKLKLQMFWLLIIILPTWINILLKTYAFIGIFSREGLANQIAISLGLPELQLLFSDIGFVIVGVYIFIPFMLLPVFNSINGIDNSIISAAQDLGATRFQTIRKVIFPLSIEGVKAGVQVVFIPALSLFMISRLIAGNKVVTLGTAIEQQFLTAENWGMGSTIGVFLIIFMMIIMTFTRTKSKTIGVGRI